MHQWQINLKAIFTMPIRGLTLAVKEPIGVIASILNNQFPLLSLVSIKLLIFQQVMQYYYTSRKNILDCIRNVSIVRNF